MARRREPRPPDRERPVGREARRPPDRERPVGREARRPPARERPVGREAASGGVGTGAGRGIELGPEQAGAGRALVLASWAGTVVFTVAALAAVVSLDTFAPVVIAVSLVLFALGCVAFAWAFAVAVNRSRTDAIGIGGLFFLAGSAPASVARSMMASVAVQSVVAVAAAAARPFSSLAFGILVPVWGLGLAGLWGARHGVFAPRGSDGAS
ncbi:MAG TPA: hypothetical protein VK866_19520 [Acidimicrobiales bacterium]|nr:hypothetical protein [Acidimicrobiales bacterium]